MIPLADGYIDFFKPGEEEPSFTIPNDHIQSLEYSERIGERKDSGTLVLNNDYDEYTDRISSGDKFEVRILPGQEALTPWGQGLWGHGVWAGGRYAWTGFVRDIDCDYTSHHSCDMTIEADDYVFAILSKRNVYNRFEETPIIEILTTIINNNANEIELYVDQELDTLTTISFDGVTLMDAVNSLLRRGDASAKAYRDSLIVRPTEPPETRFELDRNDTGFFNIVESDTDLVNFVRVDGGTANQVDEDTAQNNVNQYMPVREDNRVTFQIESRKSQIASLEIWTRRLSEDRITVRLQKDEGGEPVAIDDESSDIANNTQDYHFISNNDFTTFIMPEHTLPEPQPWVIIESDGEIGHEIGADNENVAAHKVHFPYNIIAQEHDIQSITDHVKRDGRIKADKADSVEAAHEIAVEALNHHSIPDSTVQMECNSLRMHNLRVGDVIDINRHNARGEYIIIERTDSFEGMYVESSITAQEVITV